MRGELFIMNNPVSSAVRKRRNYARINEVLEMPNLIEVQRASYSWFLEKGLKEIFDDISPIQDFTGNLVLEFTGYSLGTPKYDVDECQSRDVTSVSYTHLDVYKRQAGSCNVGLQRMQAPELYVYEE